MHNTNRIANISEEWINEVSKLERKIKDNTEMDVVCIVYDKA